MMRSYTASVMLLSFRNCLQCDHLSIIDMAAVALQLQVQASHWITAVLRSTHAATEMKYPFINQGIALSCAQFTQHIVLFQNVSIG